MAKAEYRSAIRSRQLITAALADLLQEKPLDTITVSDVVRQAGINRSTFYAHYIDIPDVIAHLIDETFACLRDEVFSQTDQLVDATEALLRRVQYILEQDLDFYRKVMNSSAFPLMQQKLVDALLQYLLQRESDFGGRDHEEYSFLLLFCAGGLTNLYREWFAGNLQIPLDEVTQRAARLLHGLVDGR